MVVTTWQDRLMMTSDVKSDQVHIRYMPTGSERALTQTVKANQPPARTTR